MLVLVLLVGFTAADSVESGCLLQASLVTGQLLPSHAEGLLPDGDDHAAEQPQENSDELEVFVRRHRPSTSEHHKRAKTFTGMEFSQVAPPRQNSSSILVAQPGPHQRPPKFAGVSKPSASPGLDRASRNRNLEMIIGVLIGMLVSLLAVVAWLGCWPRVKAPYGGLSMSASPGTHGQGLDGGRLALVQFHYQGAFFNQLSWTLEGRVSSREKDCEYMTLVLNERSQKVARAVGRLMSTPNGEMHLSSLSGGPGASWCMLKRPAPSRLPGQLWDFKVCQANGAPYSEVRQRSETKCLVNDAVSQRRIMTVIGNFTYPVFLSGERSIHVWITQPDGQSLMGAQCEAKIEEPEEGARGPTDAAPSRRFYVTTTANTDASLVLAVLLGLQDVHRAARRAEVPSESSSATTGWQGNRQGSHGQPGESSRGHRVSSGDSTVATSALVQTSSAKAAARPEGLDESPIWTAAGVDEMLEGLSLAKAAGPSPPPPALPPPESSPAQDV